MPPPAQNLPHLIVELISRYLAVYDVSKRNPMQKINCSELKHALTLASVCRTWRYPILADLYKDVTWCQLGCSCCRKCWCCGRSMPRTLANALSMGLVGNVKALNIHIRVLDIFGGEALSDLTALVGNGTVLANIKTLMFSFDNPEDTPDYADSPSLFSVRDFCEEIERLLPNATTIELHGMRASSTNANREATFYLFEWLSSLAARLSADDDCYDNLVDASKYVPLRSITIAGGAYGNRCVGELVRRHSKTLDNIVLDLYNRDTYKHMVFEKKGKLVVYPRVRSLKIHYHGGLWGSTIDTSSYDGVALFPSLESFTWYGEYIFSTAVVFHGNEQTLRCIDIDFEKRMFEIFKRDGVFADSRFAALDSVSLSFRIWREEWGLQYIQTAVALARGASVIKFDFSSHDSFEHFQFITDHFSQNLRILDLQNIRFTVPQIVSVLHTAPNICHLSILLEHSAELSSTETLHNDCLGMCKDIEDDDDIFGDMYEDDDMEWLRCIKYPRQITDRSHIDFLHSHMDLVCADLGSLNELRVQSTQLRPMLTSVQLECYNGRGNQSVFNLTELSRAAVMFTQLFPRIKQVEFYSFQLDRKCLIQSSDIPPITL